MKWVAFAAVATAVVGGTAWAAENDDYELQLVMPNAANVLDGSRVEVDGTQVGTVTGLEARDNKALVTVSVDGDTAPLHAGSKAQVEWRGLLGERVIRLIPGPQGNPEIPSGSLMEAGSEQVELDQVLAALDEPTRQHLNSTVQQLDQQLKDNPQDLRATLDSAGPAVQELGEILKAVGQDGPAIQSLIRNLKTMMEPVADRRAELEKIVRDLNSATGAMSAEQEQLKRALSELPPTLDSAKRTMDGVPAAVDETAPLLRDLRPATQQLTSVSQNLSPLLADLRPAMADLRPTLNAADDLLQRTPALLDSAHTTVPGVNSAVSQLNPAVQFLRPYTPDLMGWLSNWSAAFANYDSQGHYFHGLVQVGTNVLDDNPGVNVGLKGGPNARPAPGMASGQPWVDANGSAPR
ncbi:MlaD family protein [Saccharopolyspora endophytica]|uniref:MCE family protein n=1 Tax=Saccharopolyspora endophytica TaxID=543886 RepID=A0ABS5DB64_9PSEU|nr:MlaD family protein [Saccharopolyspora endophytica]MBQ0923531.1 MCE family protein [Saccharopolyspora endophytica]